MRTALTVLFLTFWMSVSGQFKFNGFTSDFRYYDGKKPTCYSPTVNNLNGHLMGINKELCRLDSLLQFIEADTITTAFIQAQIDSIAALIYELDVVSSDSSITVTRDGNAFDLSYVWAFNGDTSCTNGTDLDSILQYLINYYCASPPDTCCGDTVINNTYQLISGIGIFNMSAFLSDTNCFSSTRHVVTFGTDTIIDTIRATINDVEFGAWTEGDTLYATSCIRVATKFRTPCDTICRTDTLIVASANPPTTVVTDYIEINRNNCDTSHATRNDIIPCGLDTMSILSYTSGIDTAYIVDSSIYICRNNFAFENDTIYYAITSVCGNPLSDSGIVVVSSVLQPQIALSVCYDSLSGLADSALITYSLTVPSGYVLRSNSIAFEVTDDSGTYTEYGYGLANSSMIPYNTTSAGLDSANVTAYVVIESNFTGQPLFYVVDFGKIASGDCDTLTNIDTTGTVPFWYADSIDMCFQYIGYQTGGVNLNVSSGVLYRTNLSTTGITSGINLDSVIFVVDDVASPCSDDSTYQYIIENVPPYTLTDIDGNPVSVTTGVSVSFGTTSINVNAGGAISVISSIGSCTVQQYTTTWKFGWAARLNSYTFSFDGLNYSGQCFNLQGILIP